MAYLIGFWLGDGRNAGKQKKVRFKLADEEQIRYVNLLVARLLARDPKPVLMDGPFYVVDYDTSVLYDYIALPLKKLKPCIYQFKSDFLRGFFDAEGYASCSLNGSSRRLGSQVVGVATTNIEYLMIVQKLLRQLGIQSSIKTTNRKGGLMTIRGKTWRRKHDVRHLIVTGQESIRKFFDLVGFRNPTKQGKMSDLVRLFEFSPRVRFNWFVRHYEKRGSRWYRIRN